MTNLSETETCQRPVPATGHFQSIRPARGQKLRNAKSQILKSDTDSFQKHLTATYLELPKAGSTLRSGSPRYCELYILDSATSMRLETFKGWEIPETGIAYNRPEAIKTKKLPKSIRYQLHANDKICQTSSPHR
ncbi:hypothetical protein J6590_045397 [Homalodisca vitripennis]|nr:hypothetical protein J6590_045397 [Homalodisca vitripennis]